MYNIDALKIAQTIAMTKKVVQAVVNCQLFRIFAPAFVTDKAARMVESVDTRDLKSLGHCGCVGSSPTPGTTSIKRRQDIDILPPLVFVVGARDYELVMM